MGQWIEVESTPNPNALMFRVESRLSERSHEYATGDATDDSPLAQRLLAIDGVKMVMIAPEFVTVERRPEMLWSQLGQDVQGALHEFLDSFQVAVFETDDPGEAPSGEVEGQILRVLDEYVRPAVAMDGGEVHFIGFEDGVVRLALRGACGTCPSALTTLRMGVERLLTEQVPQVRAVENVLA